MTLLDGYEVLDILTETDTRVLLRARATGRSETVVIKLLTSDQPAAEDVARLQHECTIAVGLPADGIVRPLEVRHFGRRVGLVLADTGGNSLAAVIGPAGMEVGTALRLGASLARTLGRLHEAEVIHRDVKPGNVIVDADLRDARLIDFGIATRLPRVHRDATAPTRLEGTLSYMSPEQTGRMNRSVDHRSDLYSLGVTLYQMLTGRLPFATTDALELVHCHLAVRPVPPAELSAHVPVGVSDIVMHLLAKSPEERYQSADGLAHDLSTALVSWTSGAAVAPFPLGCADIPARLEIPERLYGRDAETAALAAAVDRSGAGATLVLVSGPAGIGKTALVGELAAPVTARRGYLIAGKFDQFSRNVPYACIAQAFGGLIRQLLAEPAERIRAWQDALRAALGANAGVVAAVIPELRVLLGEVAPVPALGPAETQNRFNLVFTSFVAAFAQAEHPLVAFLDDLHWADAASLKLLAAMLTDPDLPHLLVIGAYRPAEVSGSHPLTLTLQALPAELLIQVEVGPLAPAAVSDLVADTLRADPVEAAPLAALLTGRTGGNPFFLGQLLRSVAADKLIRFEGGRWTWDVDAITAHGLTDDVVEFMATRLAGLPADCQDALRVAAVIGNQVDLTTLASALDEPPAQVAADLWPAIVAGLLLPLGEGHELVRAGLADARVTYRFLHDRVQQASHATIPAPSLAAIHARVGALLRGRLDDAGEGLFEVVEHLNAAAALSGLGREAGLDLVRLNLRAARRAKASTAYDAASGHLAVAAQHLPEDGWAAAYALAYEIHTLTGEVLAALGRADEAEAAFVELVAHARDDADVARGCAAQAEALIGAGRVPAAVAAARTGLARLGVVLPEPGEATDLARSRIDDLLLDESAARSLAAAPAGDDTAVLTDRLFGSAVLAAFWAGSSDFDVLAGMAVEHVLAAGTTPVSAMAVVYLGMEVARKGHLRLGATYAEIGLELARTLSDAAVQGTVGVLAWNQPLAVTRPLEAQVEATRSNFWVCQNAGAVVFANYALACAANPIVAAGRDLRTAVECYDRSVDHGRRFAPQLVPSLVVFADLARKVTGQGREPVDRDALLDEYERQGAPAAAAFTVTEIVRVEALFGDYRAALGYFARSEALLQAVAMPAGMFAFGYFVGGAVAAAREGDLGTAHDAARQLGAMFEFADTRLSPYGRIVEAELARAEGEHARAATLYLDAVDGAAAADFPLVQGWAHELLGRLHAEHGRALATVHLREARALYLRCKADGKADQLAAEFADLAPAPARRPFDATVTGSYDGDVDLPTVLRASRAIAAETSYERVVQRIVEVGVEIAGASGGGFVPAGEDPPERALAVEILRNNELVGTLGLEHPGGPAAFNPDRIALLRLLSAQMAISLENTGLYAGLEAQVATRNAELAATLDELRLMQDQIVTSEKLAALGGLVAGVAHEISTPVGVAVTAASHLAERAAEFESAGAEGPLRRSALESFLRTTGEAGDLILANLRRAADLVASFKQVAVDSSSEARRTFAVQEYLEQIVASLGPRLASTPHRVEVECDQGVELTGYPGALAQVATNLVMNSLLHAYPDGAGGTLRFRVTRRQDTVRIVYSDDGRGIAPEIVPRIFDPFFTTRRSSGGSGLGLHIAHNLVTQRLGGTMSVDSRPGGGTRFTLEIPIGDATQEAPRG